MCYETRKKSNESLKYLELEKENLFQNLQDAAKAVIWNASIQKKEKINELSVQLKKLKKRTTEWTQEGNREYFDNNAYSQNRKKKSKF